jgi:hypothetical protein
MFTLIKSMSIWTKGLGHEKINVTFDRYILLKCLFDQVSNQRGQNTKLETRKGIGC